MKKNIYYIVLIIIALLLISIGTIGEIEFKEVNDINLGTLTVAFPVLLALIERFNEIFIVVKEESATTPKVSNRKRCSIASFAIGLLLCIGGFRILGTFINVTQVFEINSIKMTFLFYGLDCVLTAAVISGGTDGWHQIIALIGDLSKTKRIEVKNQMNVVSKEV